MRSAVLDDENLQLAYDMSTITTDGKIYDFAASNHGDIVFGGGLIAYAFADNGIAQPLSGTNTNPSAIYYEGRTYITWLKNPTTMDPHITYYDHANNSWGPQVKIADSQLTNDVHARAALFIDFNEYIHAFYGATQGAPLRHAKSDNPLDITSWTILANLPLTDPSYPNIVEYGYDIYLFYRQKLGANWFPTAYVISSDNATTWGSENTVVDYGVDMGWIYSYNVERVDDRIHVSWILRNPDPDQKRQDVFHAYFNITNGKMYAMDGTDLGTTINNTEAQTYAKIEESGIYQTNWGSLRLDAAGNPYMIYTFEFSGGWKIRFARWTGGSSATLDLQVGAGADDTYRHQTGWRNNNTQTAVGESSGTLHSSARFTNVAIPNGATINVAYLEVDGLSGSWDGAGTLTNLSLEAADDPAAPTSEADFDGRTLTSAQTGWDDMDFAGGWVQSPSIVNSVQEIVDRSGWASGQAMQVFHRDDGSSGKFAKYYAYDEGSGASAPKLHIEYTTGSWAIENITSTDHRDNINDFILRSATDIEAFLLTAGLAGPGGDVERWSWDGFTWQYIETVLTESASGEPLNWIEIPEDFDDKLRAIFTQERRTDYTTPIDVYALIGYVQDTITIVSGQFGEARDFDGLDDYVDTGLDIPPDQFSLVAVVNPDSLVSADSLSGILTKRGIASQWEWQMYAQPDGNLSFTGWFNDSTITVDLTSSATISVGSSNIIGLTWDGFTACFWIGGSSAGCANRTAGPVADLSNTITIGEVIADPDRFWDGLIDEVLIFTDVKTDLEMAELTTVRRQVVIGGGTSIIPTSASGMMDALPYIVLIGVFGGLAFFIFREFKKEFKR